MRLRFRNGIHDDKSQQIVAIANDMGSSIASGAPDVWRKLRNVNPKVKKNFSLASVQSLRDDQGNVAESYAEVRAMWHSHFSAIEAAVTIDFVSLLARVRESRDRVRGTFPLDPTVMPTVLELLREGFDRSRAIEGL